jgi:hypothetical protein
LDLAIEEVEEVKKVKEVEEKSEEEWSPKGTAEIPTTFEEVKESKEVDEVKEKSPGWLGAALDGLCLFEWKVAYTGDSSRNGVACQP